MLLSGLCLTLLSTLAAAEDAPLVPRTPVPPRTVLAPDLSDLGPGVSSRLIVKFSDAARVRVHEDGSLHSLSGAPLADVLTRAAGKGLAFRPLISLSEARIEALRTRAAQRSGRAQPDLLGILAVEGPAGPQEQARIGNLLAALPQVEFAHVEVTGLAPPGDIAPPTPDFTPDQGYLGPDPGIDALWAHAHGITGAGLRISDCEYMWLPDHEDLSDNPLIPEPGLTPASPVVTLDPINSHHGASSVGVLVGGDNGFGVTGIAYEAQGATYPEHPLETGARRLDCIVSAIDDSVPGDVVLLEMQGFTVPGQGLGPAEYDPAIHAAVSVGVSAGITIVAAAGNGDTTNLDDLSFHQDYANLGDSGAIIVGGGTPDTNHGQLAVNKYTHGSRVNLQGWGKNVRTLGFWAADVGAVLIGNDWNQSYTPTYGGTSAASPIVAGACLLVQEHAIALRGEPLDPLVLRQLLMDTALPQGPGVPIGDFVQVRAAIEAIPWKDLGSGLAGAAGTPVLDARGALLPGTSARFDLSGAAPNAQAWLVSGATAINAPFHGGVMVPAPDLMTPASTDAQGAIAASSSPTLPTGSELYVQWWIVDASGPSGWTASNAMTVTQP